MRSIKTLLINPPFSEEYSVGSSKSIRHVLNIVQPLGLAYLAAILEKNNFYVNITDCTVGISYENLFKELLKENPDVVGITATTPSFESAKFIAAKIKELLPSSVLIIGGAHVTAVPHQAMEEDYFDIGVIGEGEETFLELVKHIQEKSLNGLDVIKGIVYQQDERLITTPKREFIKSLDSLSHPARHLLPPLSKYRPTPASYRRLPLATVITSRGCPFQCVFCDRAVFGNHYRQRTADDVLAEVDEVIGRYGAKEFRFFDDLFTLDKERTYKICDGLKKRRVVWTCLTTVTTVMKELLKEMRSAGCWQVLFGLESGDPRIFKLLKKGNTIEQNRQAINWTKEAGLSVRADFIVGTPGETRESMQRTLNFAIDMDLDYAHFNKFVPFPGTELYNQLISDGYQFDFSKSCSILDHSALLYVPEGMGEEEYRAFLDLSFKKFYLRPRYILKRLLSIRTKDELLGQLKGFLAIARM